MSQSVTLTIEAGGSLISNGELTNDGRLTNGGELTNHGTIIDNSKENGGSSGGSGAKSKKQPQIKEYEVEKPIFTDVSANDWFYAVVMGVYDKGIMSGISDESFSPNTSVTRAMAIAVLWRMAGSPAAVSAADFTDVSADGGYFDALSWTSQNGLVSGYDNKKFGPNDCVTREQLVTILYRWAQLNGIDVSVGESTNILSHIDALEISEWAVPAFQWACGAGIIHGRDGGRLAPKSGATRAELAVMIQLYNTLAESSAGVALQ